MEIIQNTNRDDLRSGKTVPIGELAKDEAFPKRLVELQGESGDSCQTSLKQTDCQLKTANTVLLPPDASSAEESGGCPLVDQTVAFCKRCGFPNAAEFCPGCGNRQCAGCGDG
jgi:hypothetical protein